jgi:NAD-dependent dihydropyrimidine dehydrogenase PreA subunit
MAKPEFAKFYPDFYIERDLDKCIKCKKCVRECTYGAHIWDEKKKVLKEDHSKCVGCHRCEATCPTGAIIIKKHPSAFREHAN